MEAALLYLSAFLRPIFFANVAGPTLFELAAIGMFVALVAAFLSNAALRKSIRITTIDMLIGALSIWCITSYLIYLEYGKLREVARLLIPLFTFVVAKNVLQGEASFRRMLRFMLWGFALPIIVTSILILLGKGVEQIGELSAVNYWTGTVRYEGIYFGAHTLAHNMTFYLMILAMYMTLVRASSERGSLPRTEVAGLLLVAALAVYSLLMSQVRTALVGIIVFGGVYLYFRSRKLFFAVAATGTVASMLSAPILIPVLFPDVVQIQRGEADIDELGSGRLRIWSGNLEYFARLPIDRQIAGVGLGNNEANPIGLDSHNDYLNLLLQAGVVGFILFAAIQVLLLRAIVQLPRKEKSVFLALFIAVALMNLLSNSYISRFGLGQMFYMIMAYVELRRRTEAREIRGEARVSHA